MQKKKSVCSAGEHMQQAIQEQAYAWPADANTHHAWPGQQGGPAPPALDSNRAILFSSDPIDRLLLDQSDSATTWSMNSTP